MCYHSGPQWTWERWQWRGTLHSPTLQHYWNLTISLFSVISRTLFVGYAEMQSVYSISIPLGHTTHTYIHTYIQVLRVFTRTFNFSRYGRSPMWGLLRPRTNEGVSRLTKSTWYEWTRGEFCTGQTIWREVGFLLFFIYVSFLHFFYFKESTTVTTDKEQNEYNKKIYRNVEDKSLPIVSDYVLPIRQSSPFFFLFFNLF